MGSLMDATKKELAAVRKKYPDADLRRTRHATRMPGASFVYAADSVPDGLVVNYDVRTKKALVVPCEAFNVRSKASPTSWAGGYVQVAVVSDLGPVDLMDALRVFRREHLDEFNVLLAVVVRMAKYPDPSLRVKWVPDGEQDDMAMTREAP